MPRGCGPGRERSGLVLLFALAAFLLCMLHSHGPHVEATPGGESVSASSVHGGHATPTQAIASADCATSEEDRGQGDAPSPYPVCHNATAHVFDLGKRASSPSQDEVFAGLGALFVVGAALRPNTGARAVRWSTRPARCLAGFCLLTTIGVSRV